MRRHPAHRVDKYVVSNPASAAVTGWTLEFDVPPGLTAGQGYYGVVTRSGNHVVVVNEHCNGTVAAGRTTEPYSFWFIATGTNTEPLNCRISGNRCAGSADRVPGTPGGLAVAGTDHGGMVWEMSGDAATGTLMEALSGGL